MATSGRDVVLRLVTSILAASSCHAQFPTQETISEMPFGFWYILQDDIACEPEQYQKCVALDRQMQNLEVMPGLMNILRM